MTDLKDPRVKQYIEETVGENGMRLVDLLGSRDQATDSELAEELGEKPSHIRKILYNLYEARIAEYQKQKDKETGWLTFYWSINPTGASYALDQKAKKELSRLENALQQEESHDWYICPQGEERYDFEGASEVMFQCPEHHAMLEHYDNAAVVQNLHERIRSIRDAAEKQSSENRGAGLS